MGILVIALSINPRPLSALELKLSGLIMESRIDIIIIIIIIIMTLFKEEAQLDKSNLP